MISPAERDGYARGIMLALAEDAPDWVAVEAKFNELMAKVAGDSAALKPAAALKELFQTLMTGEPAQRSAPSELWTYAMVCPDGGLEGAAWRLRAHLGDRQLKPVELAADWAIRTEMNRFAPRLDEETPIPGLDDERMWRHFDALYLLLFRIACQRLGIQSDDFCVAIDTTTLAFYGKVNTKRVDDKTYITGFGSISGLITEPHFRDHNRSAVPAKPGTTRGHSFAVMAAYHYRTKLVFPLAVRFVGKAVRSLSACVKKFLNILKAIPAPRFIMADREFGNIGYGRLLEEHHKLTGSHYLIPIRSQGGSWASDPKNGPQEQIGASLRPKPGEALVGTLEAPTSPEGVQWAAVRWTWKEDRPEPVPGVAHGELRHWLLFFYFGKPDEDTKWDFMHRLDDASFMAMFITDVEPTQENIFDLFNEFKNRWAAVENLFRDEKGNLAYLPGKLPWTRFASFGSGLTTLAVKSLDKEQRMLEYPKLKANHPEFSIHQFRDRVADAIKDDVRRRAKPNPPA